jgi:translation initiation factor 2 beta subunit (eIF-2beta)/eIF-5
MISALRFLFVSNPFVESIAKAKRLRILLIKMEHDAEHNRHKDILEKANALKRIIGVPHASNEHCLLKLLHKKMQKAAQLPESDAKNHLKHTINEEMHLVKMLIHSIVSLSTIKENKQLYFHVQKMRDIAQKLLARMIHDLKMCEYIEQALKKSKK